MDFEEIVEDAYEWINAWHNRNFTIFPNPKNKYQDYVKPLHKLCYHNYLIWHWEDIARCSDDKKVVEAKRAIDPHNQQRNNSIEELDEFFIKQQVGKGPYNSETLGSIIDRLIISQLKLIHSEEIEAAKSRVPVIKHQQEILLDCGKELLHLMRCGKRQIINYKQMKMYNDPLTNPLHGKNDA